MQSTYIRVICAFQTRDKRKQKEQIKAERKAIMAARLAKVRQRKMVKDGKFPDFGDIDFEKQGKNTTSIWL